MVSAATSTDVGAGGLTVHEGLVSFRFDVHSVLVIWDSLNSLFAAGGSTALLVGEAEYERVKANYAWLFALGAASFQKRLYMASPDGEFWRGRESSLFNTRRDELAQMAAGSGFLVIKTQSMMATLEVFRRDDWRFSTNRTEDYGLAYQWERMITTTMGCARFLTHADPLSRSIASVPMRAVLSTDVDQGKTSLAKIARFSHPITYTGSG